MTHTVKPATPLPWRATDRKAYEAYGQRTILGGIHSQHVAEVWNGGTREQSDADANAAYIVRACNAFPELVAVLRNIMDNEWDANGATATGKSIRALLAKLGESA